MHLPLHPALLQTVELTEAGSKSEIKSPTGFVFTTTQKAFLVVIALGLLYLRLALRRRKKRKICSHCGKINPPHQSNCMECSAPLFRE